MSRDLTEAEITAIYSAFASHAVEVYNEVGECLPQLVFVEMDDDAEQPTVRGVMSLDSKSVIAIQQMDRRKEVLMKLVRAALSDATTKALCRLLGQPESEFRIDAVVHVTEVWLVDGTEDPTLGETPPSEHPDRKEGIVVTIHTRQGTHSGVSRITSTDGARRCAKVEPMMDIVAGNLVLPRGEHAVH